MSTGRCRGVWGRGGKHARAAASSSNLHQRPALSAHFPAPSLSRGRRAVVVPPGLLIGRAAPVRRLSLPSNLRKQWGLPAMEEGWRLGATLHALPSSQPPAGRFTPTSRFHAHVKCKELEPCQPTHPPPPPPQLPTVGHLQGVIIAALTTCNLLHVPRERPPNILVDASPSLARSSAQTLIHSRHTAAEPPPARSGPQQPTMAQKAKKDLAKNNAAALNGLHLTGLVVNTIFLVWHFLVAPRSLVAYGLFSTPAFICEYVLEASGRPKYDPATKALRSSGEDMGARGLTEYMFDVIWVTWACAVVVMFAGNWGWFLWSVIPAYGIYLGSGLLGMGRQKMAEMQGAGAPGQGAAPQGNRRSRRTA